MAKTSRKGLHPFESTRARFHQFRNPNVELEDIGHDVDKAIDLLKSAPVGPASFWCASFVQHPESWNDLKVAQTQKNYQDIPFLLSNPERGYNWWIRWYHYPQCLRRGGMNSRYFSSEDPAYLMGRVLFNLARQAMLKTEMLLEGQVPTVWKR